MTDVLTLENACLDFGRRQLWHNLDLAVRPGEFLAVLGPNGTGKTSLLKVILGQQALTSGDVRLLGAPVKRGDKRIGYIPQQKLLDGATPLRARDLVAFGLNGHRWGLPISTRAERAKVDELLEAVGARDYANVPVSLLSGGEQQRVRV
ncbi:MAG: ATP-binding cassette domain-containing protein, partial [Rhodoglobus sp.]